MFAFDVDESETERERLRSLCLDHICIVVGFFSLSLLCLCLSICFCLCLICLFLFLSLSQSSLFLGSEFSLFLFLFLFLAFSFERCGFLSGRPAGHERKKISEATQREEMGSDKLLSAHTLSVFGLLSVTISSVWLRSMSSLFLFPSFYPVSLLSLFSRLASLVLLCLSLCLGLLCLTLCLGPLRLSVSSLLSCLSSRSPSLLFPTSCCSKSRSAMANSPPRRYQTPIPSQRAFE